MDQSHGLGTWSERNEEIFRTNYPIHRACRDGDIDCLVSLLSAGYVDFFEEDDFYGWTPCHWASYFGKVIVIAIFENSKFVFCCPTNHFLYLHSLHFQIQCKLQQTISMQVQMHPRIFTRS